MTCDEREGGKGNKVGQKCTISKYASEKFHGKSPIVTKPIFSLVTGTHNNSFVFPYVLDVCLILRFYIRTMWCLKKSKRRQLKFHSNFFRSSLINKFFRKVTERYFGGKRSKHRRESWNCEPTCFKPLVTSSRNPGEPQDLSTKNQGRNPILLVTRKNGNPSKDLSYRHIEKVYCYKVKVT